MTVWCATSRTEPSSGSAGSRFYTHDDLVAVLCDGWRIVNLEHTETVQTVTGQVAATWCVVAQKSNG